MGPVNKIIGKVIRKLGKRIRPKTTVLKPGPLKGMLVVDGQLPPESTPLTASGWLLGHSAKHMRPEDPVLGLLANGVPYVLPWWIMKNHHAANLTLEGRPIVVKLCEMCSGAAAFDPVVEAPGLPFK